MRYSRFFIDQPLVSGELVQVTDSHAHYMRNVLRLKPGDSLCLFNGQGGEVQALILKWFPELEPDDCRSNPMGSDGEDILLSPAARKILPWNIEVKRKKKVGAARFMEQAGTHGEHEPVALFREDRGEWYAVITADYLFQLVKAVNNSNKLYDIINED